MSQRVLLTTSIWMTLTGLAAATTYTVDDTPGPGVDFNDIPPAIAASVPGDILLVAPGSYSGFVLDRGLVIVGSSASECLTPIEVRNVPAGQRGVVVNLRTTSNLVVDACAGTVILQALQPPTMSISSSNDVRLFDVEVRSTATDHLNAVQLLSSRLELVNSTVWGHNGTPSSGPGSDGISGGDGVTIAGGSRLCAARSAISGGDGTLETAPGIYAGGGGAALRLLDASEAITLGPNATLRGGGGGANWFYTECGFDAPSSAAVIGPGPAATLFESNTTFITLDCLIGFHCIPYTPPETSGVTHTTIVPADPSLSAEGPQTPGSTLTFVVYGEPGASATLNLGRGFVVQPTPGVLIERLVPTARILNLGIIPASGSISRAIPLSPTFPRGLVFGAQAEVVGTNGLRRTNSVPIVVR